MSNAPAQGLIDTPILVGWLHGQSAATRFIRSVIRAGLPQISELTAMELLSLARDQPERDNVRRFLAGCDVHPVNAAVIRRAYRIIDGLAPPSPLTPSDAIVAATAVEHKLPVYTLDPARFAAVVGPSLPRPY